MGGLGGEQITQSVNVVPSSQFVGSPLMEHGNSFSSMVLNTAWHADPGNACAIEWFGRGVRFSKSMYTSPVAAL